MDESLLWAGRVVKTQGIKGEVRVYCPGGEALAESAGKKVFLEDPQGKKRAFTVASSRPHKNMAVLSFREVRGVEEAAKLVGCAVYLDKSDLEPLPAGEFYWYQLQGLRVQTEDGKVLGVLEEIIPTGSNDVFVVRKEGKEILIPATEGVVAGVNLEEGFLVIDPLEGLLPEDDL